MLVLSRHKDQQIMIGDDVTITVVAIRGDKVRLGIDAPKDVAIHRKEIWLKIQAQQASDSDDKQSRDAEAA